MSTTTTAKHTPGPWTLETLTTTELRDVQAIVAPPLPGSRCPLHIVPAGEIWGRSLDEAEANGRIMAAAPELLEALRECITDEGSRSMTDESRNAASIARRRLDEISRVARAAIAKAGCR